MKSILFALVVLLNVSLGWACYDWHRADRCWTGNDRWRCGWPARTCVPCYGTWDKGWPSVPEQKEQEREKRQAREEKSRHLDEAYKEAHGRYPSPTVVFSPNHPEARKVQP